MKRQETANNQNVISFLAQAIPEMQANPELFQQFLDSNPILVNNLRNAILLRTNHMIEYYLQRVKRLFIAYLETYTLNPYNAILPQGYVTEGNIIVGYYTINPNILIKINIESLQAHCLNVGASGGGKSYWGGLLIPDQIIKLYHHSNLRVMIFASKKQCDQRSLITNNLPGTAYFLDKETLAINCLSPIKNVNPNLSIADTARVIATELGLMAGGQLYLQKCLFEYLSECKDGNLIDFIEWVSIKKANEKSLDYRGYRDRLLVRLQSIIFEIGSIFNCYKGIEDKVFIEENLVIEIPCSSSFIVSLISGIVLIRMFRFKQNKEYMKYKNLIIFEDIQDSIRYE